MHFSIDFNTLNAVPTTQTRKFAVRNLPLEESVPGPDTLSESKSINHGVEDLSSKEC